MRLVRTLRGRLVVIAMVWCGLFLFATGFSLQTMMRNYWQEAEADGLRLQLYDLLSRLEIQPDGLPVVTEPMADPRFRQPYSGYYWQLELGDAVVSRSRSLWDVHLSAHGLKSAFGDPDLFVGKGPNKEPLLIMTRTVLLPGSDKVFTLVMAKDSSALTQTLKKTRISLFLGLGFAATGLVLGFMFQILYGLRPLLLCGFAVLMGNLCDRLISLLRRRVYQAGDYSNESFALVITLLMPATVDWYVLAAAILAGALIGKEVFGGYGSYPFHPAAVGYAVAAVSWPEQVFRYPAPYANIPLWDASGVATSSTISDTLRSGGLINISALSLVLGEYAAPMGTGAAIVLVACGLFLWMQKDVRLSASLSFLITAGLIVFFFPRQLGLTEGTAFTAGLVFRLRCVRDEMLTGAMLFSAVFLLNEPYTCAHHRLGRILYGVMVGAFTMGFRYFGVYETGVCFAILAVNSISGWLDRTEVRLHELIKSGRQFKEKKTGKGDAE